MQHVNRDVYFLMSLISASVFAAYSSWIKQPLLTQHFLLLHRVAFIVKKKPTGKKNVFLRIECHFFLFIFERR